MAKYTLPTRATSFFSNEAYKVPTRDLFRVGDLVRAIGTTGSDGLRAGVLYEVTSIDHPCLNVKGDGLSTYGRYHSQFEKLTPEEADTFRRLGYVEGDTIQRKEDRRARWGEFVRDPGPFKAKDFSGYSVTLDRRPGDGDQVGWTATHFELVEMRPRRSTPVEAPALFKVGDRVEVTTSRFTPDQKGDIGIIIEIRSASLYLPYRVDFTKPGCVNKQQWGTWSSYDAADLKLAPLAFKVGDKVCFNANTPGLWWVKPGKMGSINNVRDDGKFDVKLSEGHIMGADASMLDPVEALASVNDNEAPRFIICVERNGKFAPAASPREYKSEAQAWEVANSMADKHPGDKFYVLRTVGAVKVEKTVTVKATKTVAA